MAGAFFHKGDLESGHVERRIRRKSKESRGGKGEAYGKRVRTIREEPPGPRWNGAGFYLSNGLETFDAETFVIMRGTHSLASRKQTG